MSWATPFLELTDQTWETELRVNLTSHYVLAQRLAKAMVGTGGGVILFTASVNALGAGRGFAPYCATKSALVSLCRVMAVESPGTGSASTASAPARRTRSGLSTSSVRKPWIATGAAFQAYR